MRVPMSPRAPAPDPSSCRHCGGLIDYDLLLSTSACTSCGTVADADPPLLPDNRPPGVHLHGRPLARHAKVSLETLERKVDRFVAAGMTAACALGQDSFSLKQRLYSLARETIELHAASLRGKPLARAGAAAALLVMRQEARPVTLADVCRVARVSEKALNDAYKRLVGFVKPALPPMRVEMFVPRFREGALALALARAHADDDDADEEAKEAWESVAGRARMVLEVAERVWASAGRRPVVVAGAAVVVAVRMHTHRRAVQGSTRRIDVVSVLLCDVPSVAGCCKRLAGAAGVPARTLVDMHRKMGRPLVEALKRVLPEGRDVRLSDFHEHVGTLHGALFSEAAGGGGAEGALAAGEITRGILPDARRKSDRKTDGRRAVLRRVRGGIAKSGAGGEGVSKEVEAIAQLVKKGASDAAILSGYYDAVGRQEDESAATSANEKEEVDSDDSDVEAMLRPAEGEVEGEGEVEAALAAARRWK